ncbi:Chaperone protein PapD precursor [compost metagenome]
MTRQTEKQGGGALGDFKAVMLKPKSNESVKLRDNGLNSFVVSYINDYGGHPELRFVCNGSVCNVVPDAKK